MHECVEAPVRVAFYQVACEAQKTDVAAVIGHRNVALNLRISSLRALPLVALARHADTFRRIRLPISHEHVDSLVRVPGHQVGSGACKCNESSVCGDREAATLDRPLLS